MARFGSGEHAAARRQAASLEGEDATYAIVLTHPDLATPVRVVADTVEHTIALDGGAAQTFLPLQFYAELPQDNEGQVPTARLRIDNIGRPLTTWVERTHGGRGATARIVVVQRPDSGDSEVLFDVALRVGRAAVSAEYVTVSLTNRQVYGRPAVKVRHDTATSPGLY